MSEVSKTATISPSGLYRYRLGRTWGIGETCLFVMLNPSTADAERDDATIRKCMGFARRWGFDGIEVVNLFAYRATDPKMLRRVADPVGPLNDQIIEHEAILHPLIVAAWGANGGLLGRSTRVRKLLGPSAKCFRIGKTGEPDHPLYQPYERELIPLEAR